MQDKMINKLEIANRGKLEHKKCFETAHGLSKVIAFLTIKASEEGLFNVPDTIYFYQSLSGIEPDSILKIGEKNIAIISLTAHSLSGKKTLFKVEKFNEKSGEIKILLQHVRLVKDFKNQENIIKSGLSFSVQGRIDSLSCDLSILSESIIEH